MYPSKLSNSPASAFLAPVSALLCSVILVWIPELLPGSLCFSSYLERQFLSRVAVSFPSVWLVSCLVLKFPKTWECTLFLAGMECASCTWYDCFGKTPLPAPGHVPAHMSAVTAARPPQLWNICLVSSPCPGKSHPVNFWLAGSNSRLMYVMEKTGGVISECRLISNQGGFWMFIEEFKFIVEITESDCFLSKVRIGS